MDVGTAALVARFESHNQRLEGKQNMNGANPQSAQQEAFGSQTAKAYAAASPTSRLAPSTIRRRMPGPKDVQIDILYCGVCHSDLHQARNEWQSAMPTVYPCVPGHKIFSEAPEQSLSRLVRTNADQRL